MAKPEAVVEKSEHTAGSNSSKRRSSSSKSRISHAALRILYVLFNLYNLLRKILLCFDFVVVVVKSKEQTLNNLKPK